MQHHLTNFESVGQFHLIFGHPKPLVPQENIAFGNPKLMQFRLSLIKEEFKELQTALNQNDMVEVIDALGDILYVIYGMGQVMGVNLDKEFRKYCETDMGEKCMECLTNFECVKKIKKNLKQLNPPNIQMDIMLKDPNVAHYHIFLIQDQYNILEYMVVSNNFDGIVRTLSKLLFVVYGMGQVFGIELDNAFQIVHASNMSKLCNNETEAQETVEHYKTLAGFENIDVRYRLSTNGKYFVIFNAETGKILKSKYFSLPDFREMIDQN